MSDETRFDGVGVIRTKRENGVLSPDQIRDLMRAYMTGEFAEEQMSALLMAIFWRGMTAAETAEWTGAMIASGDRIDLSGLSRPSVDKHSTGGVGDKISLILVPLVAVFGAAVPQMSGRAGPAARSDRRRHRRGQPRAGPGRPAALRAARHHRHRRVDPADRQLDHVQEGGRGHPEPAARHQGGHRGVHDRYRPGPAAR